MVGQLITTHITRPVAQSSAESEYNVAWTAGMSLAHSRMLVHEFLNKDPDIVPEEAPLIILDIKSDIFMTNNGKYTKHTRIAPSQDVHFFYMRSHLSALQICALNFLTNV